MAHHPHHRWFRTGQVWTLVLATIGLTGVMAPDHAQADNPSLRAANLARMTAEKLNGGLQNYTAAACMHQRAGGSCLAQATKAGYLFVFPGGKPGWQPLGKPATVETEIMIAPDGRSVLEVRYNGPPRDVPGKQASPD
jgi:hypothetical protein